MTTKKCLIFFTSKLFPYIYYLYTILTLSNLFTIFTLSQLPLNVSYGHIMESLWKGSIVLKLYPIYMVYIMPRTCEHVLFVLYCNYANSEYWKTLRVYSSCLSLEHGR